MAVDPMLLATIVGSLGTVGGALAAWHFARRAERATQEDFQLSAYSAVQEWRRELLGWAREAIQALSEAQYALSRPAAARTAADTTRCLLTLSSLIDQGRLYLPNQDRDQHGREKLFAYRGFRHATLDPLVAAHRVLEGTADAHRVLEGTAQVQTLSCGADAIWQMRRIFVSRVQMMLDPDRQNAEIKRLIGIAHEERASDPTLGGLLPAPGSIPSGADALLGGRGGPPPLARESLPLGAAGHQASPGL